MIERTFFVQFLLLAVMLWQPALAQVASLPSCTAVIQDTDGDGVLDNDGVGGTIDIDKDGDGLIELCDLEGIDEMRYQLDGTGYAISTSTEKITAGCPGGECRGYELVKSLDFTDVGSYRSGVINTAWTTGAGWQPIGDAANPFIGTFAANIANNTSLTISNLMINRADEDFVGLFAATDDSSILGIRLLEVDIKGRFAVGGIAGLTTGSGLIANSSVEGSVEGSDAWIGGLVGAHYSTIINGYAKGTVKGHTSVGGLVGYSIGWISNSYAAVDVEARAYSGGLVGYNQNRTEIRGGTSGRIINSYASGSVRSGFSVGGLVGHNDNGTITNVYASGNVVGSEDVGGLVGYNDAERSTDEFCRYRRGCLSNGYATGAVAGGRDVGGLVGYNAINATISNSYWDSDASGIATSAGGTSKTSVELRSSIPTESIYVGWSQSNWGFGSQDLPEYPTLKYTPDDDSAISCGSAESLPDCATDLPDQGQAGSQGQLALKTLILSTGVLEPLFDPTHTYYEILDIPAGQTDVTVTVTANNQGATITIGEQSVSQATLELSTIGATAETGINIVLTAMGQTTKHYTIVHPPQPVLTGQATSPCGLDDIDRDDDGLIEVCDIEGLYAMRYQADGTGYTTSTSANKITSGCDADDTMQCRGYELARDLDFNEATHYRDSRNQMIWTVADYTDTTDRGWRPIGHPTNPFNAVFRGNGYTITNLAINRSDADYVGLFGDTASDAEISGVGLEAVDVRGRFSVGALVGRNNRGTVEHSYISGDVSGRDMMVGGLAGSHKGRINNSYARGTVSGNRMVGGLVGIFISNDAGSNSTSTIINSYAMNDVAGRSFVGGLVGSNGGLISNSYERRRAISVERGGTGSSGGLISNSYASGRVESIFYSGGLVGLNFGNIQNSYASGTVSGSDNIGGLVGDNSASIENSYAIGAVMGNGMVGGLVGYNSIYATISNSYWDKEASGIETSAGSANENGLTTDEFLLSGLFAGWSSERWDFALGRYPILKYIVGDDNANPACSDNTIDAENTDLPLCGTVLSYQTSLTLTGSIVGATQANEGDMHTLTAPMVSGGSGNYSYEWTQTPQNPANLSNNSALTFTGINTAAVNVGIPVDFIAANAEAATIVFELVVNDGTYTIMQSKELTIHKKDNGVATFRTTVAESEAQFSVMAQNPMDVDVDGDGAFAYQWQKRNIHTEWEDIAGETNTAYTAPTGGAADSADTRYRVHVIYTDKQGYKTIVAAGPFTYRTDIDSDDDGLIEIYYLEDLDAIRYQLDGSGYQASADAMENTSGCAEGGDGACNGYELARSLDFNDIGSYTNIENKDEWHSQGKWQPIGQIKGPTFNVSGTLDIKEFESIFEGNGHTLSNLSIDISEIDGTRVRGVGLFGYIIRSAVVRNIGLLNVNIQNNKSGDPNFRPRGAGGLVGINDGTVINSYVIGTVNGDIDGNSSLFREYVGGLVGNNLYKIINSYANVQITGYRYVGGLVGENCHWHDGSCRITRATVSEGQIINSYANGSIDSYTFSIPDSVNGNGGLVGANRYSISNSYTRVMPTSNSIESKQYGGLVGSNSNRNLANPKDAPIKPIITASHWLQTNSEVPDVIGVLPDYSGVGRSAEELQAATMASSTSSSEVYYNWSSDDWDFGTAQQYPILRYAGQDAAACSETVPEHTIDPPQCGAFLKDQGIGLRSLSVSPLQSIGLDPLFSSEQTTYTVVVKYAVENLGLNVQAYNFDADIKVGNLNLAVGSTTTTIPLSADTTVLDIAVTDIETTTYTLTIHKSLSVSEVGIVTHSGRVMENNDGTVSVDEGSIIEIETEVSGSGDEYTWTQTPADAFTVIEQSISAITLQIPNDFVASDESTRNSVVTLAVSNPFSSAVYSETLTIGKIDNGLPDIDFIGTSRTLTVSIKASTDPDGDAPAPEYQYQWQRLLPAPGSQWETIETITTKTATVSYDVPADTTPIHTRFSVLVMLTDRQNHTTTTRIGNYLYRGGNADDNDNGLIDIYTLEDLDAVRNHLTASYELRANLDFNDPLSYADTSNMDEWRANDDRTNEGGWTPILIFSGIFDGNGYTISNLYINRLTEGTIGLFGILLEQGEIKNVGLLDVDIQAKAIVGSLAGLGNGKITESYATGAVRGSEDNVGGLVGSGGLSGETISSFTDVDVTGRRVVGGLLGINGALTRDSYALGRVTGEEDHIGGLIGTNQGSIINSYASGAVNGKEDSGGLVGIVGDPVPPRRLATVINSYATGEVVGDKNSGGLIGTIDPGGYIENTYATGNVSGGSNIGGLVGNHQGLIINSYASGVVEGNNNIGGLVGITTDVAVITASYWDVDTSLQTTSAGGTSRTTVELQSPIAPGTTATEVYYNWKVRDWDFGDSRNYPALRYAAGPDEDACNTDITISSEVPQCGTLLPEQPGRDKGLAAVFFLADGKEATVESTPLFSPLTFAYDVTTVLDTNINDIQLRPFAINNNATIAITKQGDDAAQDHFSDKASGALSDLIALDDQTTLTIVVTDNVAEDTVNTTYTIAITRLMPLEVLEVAISSQPPANTDGTINEGSDVTLSFDVTGGTGNYEYVYFMEDEQLPLSGPSLMYSVAADFLAADVTTQNVTFQVIVHDGALISSRSIVITILKIDNGNFDIALDVSPSRLSIRSVGSDPDGEGTFTYLWQKRGIGEQWTTATTTATYGVPEEADGSIRYRVDVKHIDGQGYTSDYSKGALTKPFILTPIRADIDTDDDGLIEVYYLEDLDAIRHQLDGSGYQASDGATESTSGCAEGEDGACNGYELARSLDFNDAVSYTNIENKDEWHSQGEWQPIGQIKGPTFESERTILLEEFESIFEGNGHTLSNLFIDISEIDGTEVRGVGLFGYITRSAVVRNIGLLNVNIQNNQSGEPNWQPRGVGGLVGINDGTVINSYVIGTVDGDIIGNLSHLREYLGGLVGNNLYKIINSYADVRVSGYLYVGGLVGENCHWRHGSCRITRATVSEGQIINSYANGTIDSNNFMVGSKDEGNGGLVGANRYSISNSYTRIIPLSNSIGSARYGGLVGSHYNSNLARPADPADPIVTIEPIITASHWLQTTSTITDVGGGVSLSYSGAGRSAEELQAATMASSTSSSEVYYNWSSDDWDFGTAQQYPILRYAAAEAGGCSETAPEHATDPPQCGAFLKDQGIGLRDLHLSTPQNVSLVPLFSSAHTAYAVAVPSGVNELSLSLQAYNSDAMITVGDGNAAVGSTSTTLILDTLTSLNIQVDDRVINEDTDTFSTTMTTYTLAINKLSELMISEVAVDVEGAIDEGTEITLSPTVVGGTAEYRYRVEIDGQPVTVINQSTASVTIRIADDLIAVDAASGEIIFTVIVEDGLSTTSSDKVLTITKQDNGEPTVTAAVNGSEIDISIADDDPDGEITTASYVWQRRDINDEEWMDIVGAMSSNYSIPQATSGSTLYRVLVTYTDAQGYGADMDNPITLGPYRVRGDMDDDNDGLIDIYYLEDLDAIRNQFADMPATCGADSDQPCNGFALHRSLDFNEASHYETMEIQSEWTTGEGWQPIGDIDNPFTSTFTAIPASLTISNLMIKIPEQDNVALFGVVGEMSGASGRLSDIHLRDANVSGRFAVGGLVGLANRSSLITNSSVVGLVTATEAWVGVMVGSNYGAIINGYADGSVQGKSIVGGLAGYSFGPISNSYAHSNVIGRDYSGGLVGYNHNEKQFSGGGNITNSYASGSVEGVFHVGGLVGYNDDGAITDAYALGNVIGNINVGSLIGSSGSSGTIVNVYASGSVAGGDNVGDLVGFYDGTVVALATTPTLVYVAGPDSYGNASCGSELPTCGTALPGQDRFGGAGALALKNLTLSAGVLDPPFDPTKTYYEILDIPDNQTDVVVAAEANISDVSIAINAQAVSRATIQLNTVGATTGTGIHIVLTAMDQTIKQYTIVLPAQSMLSQLPTTPCSLDDIDRDDDGLIEICDIEGLYAMRYQMDGTGYTTSTNAIKITAGCGGDGCRGYELVRDLDFNNADHYRDGRNQEIWTVADHTDITDRGWRPIGTFANPFNARFEGNTSYTISNLAINRDDDYMGLFGAISSEAEINDVGLSDANVNGRFIVGGLVGWNNQGTITNSHISGVVTASEAWIGGLVGDNIGFIANSYADGTVSGNRTIGGLVGINIGTISNSRAENEVTGRSFIGGLVGINVGEIRNSYTTKIVDESIYYAGGLVSLNVGSIKNSYATGNISGGDRVGGLVGDNRNLVAYSYAIGTVSGSRLVGELVGINSGTITDSYATGSPELIGFEFADVGRTINSSIVSVGTLQSPRPGWSPSDWGFANGNYPALKYSGEDGECETPPPETAIPNCGTLLSGQFPMLLSLTTEAPATLFKTGDFTYSLRIAMNINMVALTPTVNDGTVTINYRVDDGTETAAMNSTPFTASLPDNAQTITITLDPADESARAASYTINIERIILTHIKVYLEGLLQP